jgi:hypothetical protein
MKSEIFCKATKSASVDQKPAWENDVPYVFKDIPLLYCSQNFIIAFTKSATGLSRVRWLRSIPSNPDTLWFFLILSTCLRVGFISAFFPSGARTKYFEPSIYPYLACYMPHAYYHLFVYHNIVKKSVGLRPLAYWDLGSNRVGGMDVCLLWLLCVVR